MGELITEEIVKEFIKEQNEPFNCEFSFQFALAWYLKEKFKDEIKKVEFEKKIYTKDDKKKNDPSYCRCDLVLYKKDNNRILLELKYVVQEEGAKSSGLHRASFIKDLKRLKNNNSLICSDKIENKIINIENDERYCIFITDKTSIFSSTQRYESNTFTDQFNMTFGNPNSIFHEYWIKDLPIEKNMWCLFVDAKNINIAKLNKDYKQQVEKMNKQENNK